MKASLRSLAYDVSGLTIPYRKMSTVASALELDLTRIGTNILMPIHSTHSHRASEDTEEDPT